MDFNTENGRNFCLKRIRLWVIFLAPQKKVTLGDKVVKKLASLPTNIRRYGYCGKQQLNF